MPLWSPGTFLLISYNKGSFTTGLDNRILLYFLVNSKSSIWPLSWSHQQHVFFKPNSSKECRNFRVSTLFRFSTWMLKLPVMRNSSDVTTNVARCWEISSVNLDTLNEGVYMRQLFWMYDSVSTRHMQCAQSNWKFLYYCFSTTIYRFILPMTATHPPLWSYDSHHMPFFRISYETKQMIHI